MKKAQKIKYKVNNKLRGFGETDFERRKITVNKKKNKIKFFWNKSSVGKRPSKRNKAKNKE